MTASGRIGEFRGRHAFLSNFWREKDGLTLEHRFQAAKLSHDPQAAALILAAPTPSQAKFLGSRRGMQKLARELGRPVTLRPGWDGVRLQVMHDLLSGKFSDPEIRDLLLATGEAELVEGNTWNDRFWGVCGGKGENWLGRLLMRVRDELRAA